MYKPETSFQITPDNRLVYNLKHEGYYKGEERFRNDIAVSICAWEIDKETMEKVANTIQKALNEAFPIEPEKLWCAACGIWGTHTSGSCPELKKI